MNWPGWRAGCRAGSESEGKLSNPTPQPPPRNGEGVGGWGCETHSRERNTMTKGNWVVAGLLTLAPFLAAAGGAQGPAGGGQKPPAGAKVLAALDLKAVEDPRAAETAATFLEKVYDGKS